MRSDDGNEEPYACAMCDRYERTIEALTFREHQLVERLEWLLIATQPGMPTLLDHERDESRALLTRIENTKRSDR